MKRRGRGIITRLKHHNNRLKQLTMHKKLITIPTRLNSLIQAHQNFIIALAKGLIAPLNTSTKPVEYCSLDKD
jgi:hypothetical protein